MLFEKNKKYFSSLTEVREDYWVCDNPLFVCGNKGLFPVYRAEKRYGVLNKNYHELIFKEIPEEQLKAFKIKPVFGNKGAKNVSKFEEDKWNI